MTTLSSGVLLKLLDGMKSGAAKPVGEHRTAVLQVTDIVPAELDEADLFVPKHGRFYVKVSDASHSIYATLPPAQADLVLSNKLSLGQFVHVDRLDPASPVPVIVGAKPLPGRHPLVVGTPDPAGRGKPAAPRRGSWGPEQNAGAAAAIKPTTLNFDGVRMTPVKERPAMSTPVKDHRSAAASTPARDRGAAVTPGRERGVAASPAMSSASVSVRKSSSVLPRLLTRCKSFVADRDQQHQHPRIPKSTFPAERSSVSCCTASKAMRRVAIAREEEPSSPPSDDELGSSATSTKKRPAAAARVPVPGKLTLLGKDAIEQREQAQKVALEALRNASATDNVARIYKMFSELSKTARPEAPATCFESFLNFHNEAVQAVTDIEAVQAATSMAAAVASDEQQQHEDAPPPVLQEIAQNRAMVRRRGIGFGSVSKSVSFAPGTLDPKQDDGGGRAIRTSSASRKCLAMDKVGEDVGDEKRSSCSAPSSPLGSSLKLAKQIQAEAGGWFMDFLEAALETGLKKKSKASAMGDGRKHSSCSCPQSLMLRVINWVEMEQSGGGGGDSSSGRRTAAHPRAAAVARKLRIKAKNPS